MNAQELSNLQCRGREDIDRDSLKDIREIKVDMALPPVLRIAKFMDEVKNPYLFRVGNAVVQLGWSKEEVTIQEQMAELFRLQCQ